MSEMNKLGFVFVWLILAISSQARIITVDDDGPADFTTIQSAIDDANDGDTVFVADGIYRGDGNRDIDFKGKAITLRSENGPEKCIINCERTMVHRGFYFHSGEDFDSILSGFTITNGYLFEGDGAGIYLRSSSPTIEGCIITNNEVGYLGIIMDSHGGGIYCGYNSSPTITNSIISNNKATCSEAGWSFSFGAGVYCSSTSSARLTGCTISGNLASLEIGGGILNDGGNVVLTKCVVTGNTVGVDSYGGSLILTQCIFSTNFCSLGIGPGKARLINCTFAGNLYGIGVSPYLDYELILTNCILWGNPPPPEIGVGIGTVLATDSDIQGGWPGEGNINVDPCFAKPGYRDPNGTPLDPSDDSWTEGDYHLKSQAGRWDTTEGRWTIDEVTSLCIDAGDPTSPIGIEPFPNGGIINMGAYGGTREASKSYFGESVCETIVAGDINGDCVVNLKDFALIAYHWLEER